MTTYYTNTIEADFAAVYSLIPSATNPTDVSSVINSASAVVETISGVILDADLREIPIRTSDAAWVRKAIVFQAAWMIEQYGVLGRQGVSSLSQDGLSMSAPDGLTFVLAPLAKRALNNCSWTKSGTVRVAPSNEVAPVDFLVNDNHAWTPMDVA